MKFSFSRDILILLCTFLGLSVSKTNAQAVGWEATGFPGAASINEEITQVEWDPAGRFIGILSGGPRYVISSDQGRHWTFKEIPFSNINGFKFFQGWFYISTISNGLHRSQNLTDWNAVPLPDNELEISLFDGNRGFIEIETKFHGRVYSTDGVNFTTIPSSVGYGAMAFNGSNEVLYVSKDGYWRSAAGSTEWEKIGDGIGVTGATVIGDSLYLAIFHQSGQPLVVMSKLGAPLDFDTMFIDGGLPITMLHTVDDSILLAKRGAELHHSFNRKDLSPPFAYPSTFGSMTAFTITGNDDYIIATGTTYPTMETSTDHSDSWKKISQRLEANIATELLSVQSNILYAATNQGFLMRSDDKGATWITKSDLVDTITLLSWTNPNRLWVGQPGKLLVSSDGGESFIGFDGFSARTPSSMVVGRNGKIYLGTDSGIFISENGGDTWFVPASLYMHIIYPQKRFPPVLSLSIDSMNRLYVGTTRGIIVSLDEGNKYETGWLQNSPIYAIQTAKDGRVYVGSHWVQESDTVRENFYTSRDPLSPRMEDRFYTWDHSINPWDMNALNLNSKQQLIAGTLFTWRGGLEWEISEIEGVPPPVQVIAQTIDENDIVYISYYDKVYRSAAPKVSSVKRGNEESRVILYPNPASDILQIDNTDEGTLRLLNTLGEEVLVTRVSGSDQVGISHLPAGVYFCQFVTKEGSFSQFVVISR